MPGVMPLSVPPSRTVRPPRDAPRSVWPAVRAGAAAGCAACRAGAAREAGAVAAGALPYAPARTEQAGHASRPWPRRTLVATAICWPSRRG
ncbi:hypothetical protein SGLAM104S_07969 [Streptomyces glaucescens]